MKKELRNKKVEVIKSKQELINKELMSLEVENFMTNVKNICAGSKLTAQEHNFMGKGLALLSTLALLGQNILKSRMNKGVKNG